MFLTNTSKVIEPTRLPPKYHSRVASKLSDVIGFRNGLPARRRRSCRWRRDRTVRKLRMSARAGRAKSLLAARRKIRSLAEPELQVHARQPVTVFVDSVVRRRDARRPLLQLRIGGWPNVADATGRPTAASRRRPSAAADVAASGAAGRCGSMVGSVRTESAICWPSVIAKPIACATAPRSTRAMSGCREHSGRRCCHRDGRCRRSARPGRSAAWRKRRRSSDRLLDVARQERRSRNDARRVRQAAPRLALPPPCAAHKPERLAKATACS